MSVGRCVCVCLLILHEASHAPPELLMMAKGKEVATGDKSDDVRAPAAAAHSSKVRGLSVLRVCA